MLVRVRALLSQFVTLSQQTIQQDWLNKNTSESMASSSSSPTAKQGTAALQLSEMKSWSIGVENSNPGPSEEKNTKTEARTSTSTSSSRKRKISDLPFISISSGSIQTFSQFEAELRSFDTYERAEILSAQMQRELKTLAVMSDLLRKEIMLQQFDSSQAATQKSTSSTKPESKATLQQLPPLLTRNQSSGTGLRTTIIHPRSLNGDQNTKRSCCQARQESEKPSSPDASLTPTQEDTESVLYDTEISSSPLNQGK